LHDALPIFVEFHRSIKARREVDLDAVGTEYVRQYGCFFQVGRGEDQRIGVDVSQHGAVNAYRSMGAGIIAIAWFDVVGKFMPIPYREARITALHGSVEVVPVV